MKLVGTGFDVNCPFQVALQFEYVSNFFDGTAVDDTMEMILPIEMDSIGDLNRIIEFGTKNLETPVPDLSKSVVYIQGKKNYEKESIPDWAKVFIQSLSDAELMALIKYSNCLGFHVLTYLGCFQAACIMADMSAEEIAKTFPIPKASFTNQERMELRKMFLETIGNDAK